MIQVQRSERFEEALKLRLELKTPGKKPVTRSNIGYAQILSGNLSEAFKELDKALSLSRRTDERFEGYTLMRLGMAHFKQALATTNASSRGDELEKAIEHYLQALEVQTRIGDIRGQAMTFQQIAELYSSIEQAGNARINYRKAQEQWKAVNDSLENHFLFTGWQKLNGTEKIC
jgi:tetratricopeptide (TPR) repeat protein